MIQKILRFLWTILTWFFTPKPMSTPPNPAIDLGVDPLPEVTAGLTLAGDVVKAVAPVVAALDSPEAILARKNAAEAKIVAQEDADLKEAQQTGDLTKADADASG